MARTVAVTGKGGVGKTTVSALIVRHLKLTDPGPVLALDADPDANLATVLCIPLEKTVGDLREETVKEIKSMPPGMSKHSYIEAGLHEVVVEMERVDMITMGRSEGPGCYCYVNNLLREFSDNLQSSYRWIVTDNEAGLEHLSRRTAMRIDDLVVVANANPLSLDCATRIAEITADLRHGVVRKWLLANRVDNEAGIARVAERAAQLGMGFLGAVPPDAAVEACVFEGRSLFELDQSPAAATMDEMMQRIKSEQG